MGSPRRLRKLFEHPKKLWDANRIETERKLLSDYGLKNMHELWRMQTILRKIRREARLLLSRASSDSRSTQLLMRVQNFLIPKPQVTLDDVLALDTRDILERRLQTLLMRKSMARTSAQARQYIVHGHVSIGGRKCTSPSRLLTFTEESTVAWLGQPPQGNATAADKSSLGTATPALAVTSSPEASESPAPVPSPEPTAAPAA